MAAPHFTAIHVMVVEIFHPLGTRNVSAKWWTDRQMDRAIPRVTLLTWLKSKTTQKIMNVILSVVCPLTNTFRYLVLCYVLLITV